MAVPPPPPHTHTPRPPAFLPLSLSLSLFSLQFGKHPRKYEVAESHRFFNWVIEQLIETINLYKDGFQVMVSVAQY